MKITNTTKSNLGLSPEVVVPAGGTIEVTKEQADAIGKNAVVEAWFEAGMLKEVKAAKPKTEKQDTKPKADAPKADK